MDGWVEGGCNVTINIRLLTEYFSSVVSLAF